MQRSGEWKRKNRTQFQMYNLLSIQMTTDRDFFNELSGSVTHKNRGNIPPFPMSSQQEQLVHTF